MYELNEYIWIEICPSGTPSPTGTACASVAAPAAIAVVATPATMAARARRPTLLTTFPLLSWVVGRDDTAFAREDTKARHLRRADGQLLVGARRPRPARRLRRSRRGGGAGARRVTYGAVANGPLVPVSHAHWAGLLVLEWTISCPTDAAF